MSLISLFSSTTRNIRKVGYIKDQKGILKRYNYEYENWQSHLQKCKEIIISQFKNCNANKVAVLGSGWLLDVPINELINNFNRIDLYDINHPKPIKRKYENNLKVNFIEKDLTNGLINKANEAKIAKDFLSELDQSKSISFEQDYDLVISINILNQLDIMLCDYIERKFKIDDSDLKLIRSKIQRNHIELLNKYNSCLISDCVEQQINKGDVVKENNLLYCDLLNGELIDSWIWNFDTRKTYNSKYTTSFIVKAYNF